MRINTNVSSLNAQESTTATNSRIKSSLEKLSSGLKINKAADDASGLAIADKLRTQATSINQGVDNGNSAVSLLQIADKSMAEQSNILDTVKAKLIQANTATTSADGRESIRKDIKKLLEQLDNIAEQTNYNGNTLLQANHGNQDKSDALSFQVGETEGDLISLGQIQSNTEGLVEKKAYATGTNVLAGDKVTLKGDADNTSITIKGVDDKDDTNDTLTNATITGKIGNLTAAGSDLTIKANDAVTRAKLDELVKADEADGTAGESITKNDDGTFNLKDGVANDLGNINASITVTGGTAATTLAAVVGQSNFTVTNNDTTNQLDVAVANGAKTVGLDSLADLATEGDLTRNIASEFQNVVNDAISTLNGYRGDVGSTQNQVESAVRNLMTQATNVKAAESIIRDVDYAKESANFNKNNIIAQAGSYAISQANNAQQNVMKLLQ